jgi:beta-glucosidase
MPYHTISFGQDARYGENVGNGFSRYLINDLLRGRYGYDGVVCTDWGITGDVPAVATFAGKPWGMETKSVVQRHYKVLMAGVDQFGGNSDAGPVLEAYKMGVQEHGEADMRQRFEQSAVRLLKNVFRVGLFENPYLDPKQTAATVGKPEFMAAGYEAQRKSIVMLKNRAHVLPLHTGRTVYIPKRVFPPVPDWFGRKSPERIELPVPLKVAQRYFRVTDDPAKADFALCFIESPSSGRGYDQSDRDAGGNGYLPISLQYRPYRADLARDPSIAGGDPYEDFTNRSFRGNSTTTSNVTDMQLVLDTRKAMGSKPVIVAVEMSNPMVFAEIEKAADAILVGFGVQAQAVFDILTGAAEPSGLLPLQMPADMKTVEEQLEDVPRDMRCHVDAEGHAYDFGYGMSWSGVIRDARTARYAPARRGR